MAGVDHLLQVEHERILLSLPFFMTSLDHYNVSALMAVGVAALRH
jgi:hypothetical protein